MSAILFPCVRVDPDDNVRTLLHFVIAVSATNLNVLWQLPVQKGKSTDRTGREE